MKRSTQMMGITAFWMLMSSTIIGWAQPDLNNAPKGGNPPNREKPAKREKRMKRKAGEGAEGKANAVREERMSKLVESEARRVEALTGKPLSDEQKQQLKEAMTARITALRAAQDTYLSEVARMTGLTVDELRLKMRGKNGLQNGRRGRRDKDARDAAQANGGAAPA